MNHVNNRPCLGIMLVFRYVLLHHMMGGTGWSYPEGGMGAVTQAMAAAAASYGAHIFTNVVSSLYC
jgi:phytoene dehydrogenase-like protein